MAATGTPVFHGLVYGAMVVANEEIRAACERAALLLPGIVERVRLIEPPVSQECRDCHRSFAYTLDADICPACVAVGGGEGVAA